MLIVDEVQGGFCRSGRIWAFNHDGIEPDIMVTGKGITGGFYPCGAMSYHPRYREKFFDPLPIHVASYAGNEFASQLAGSLARRYGDPALCTHVNAVGDRLFRGLLQIVERYPDILKPGIRGRGLICAVDVRDVELRDDIVATCMDVGLYLRGTRLAPHAINFQPPLVITAPEIDEVLNRFDSAVQRVRKI